jgi:tRNA(His) 5'-end guanylyltransferase
MEMSKDSNDALGTRMKGYEMAEAGRRLMPLLPVMIRLDGQCFHTFCKGLERPYDEGMSLLMTETTAHLVRKFNAVIGYTQSDEISLILYVDNMKSQLPYNGRIQKLIGDGATSASSFFKENLMPYLPDKVGKDPQFDCRVWNVPSKEEAVNSIMWREFDATKNSISMAAQSMFSHKELQGKNGSEMQDMMMLEKGVNWNDYPAFFKRGTYFQRKIIKRKFLGKELEKLPPRHHARLNPDLEIERSVVAMIEMPPITKVTNRVEVFFDGAKPVTGEECDGS